ncbi:MAG TPA: hypothetical protein VHW23_43755 [Kofleriaceae bacterium]|nr:hypothetical protein [Kofleriaceae bacterium]
MIPLPVNAHFYPARQSPTIRYGELLAPAIEYFADDGHFVRVSFDCWNALRCGRGIYLPYSRERVTEPMGSLAPRFFVVDNSPWLPERYAYEKAHDDEAYHDGSYGGDVEDMLIDFSHYLLSFHRECIEVIARGIWFERSRHPLEGWQADHPSLDLGPEHRVDAFTYRGQACEIRQNRLPLDEIRRRALLCEQPLVEFLCHYEDPYVLLRLSIRERDGATTCTLRPRMGRDKARYRSIPSLDEVRQRFFAELDEVERRRRDPA